MLNISNVSKTLGGQKLYSKASLQIYPGEKVGLVGANGTGKSTLFRMIIGEISPEEGQISFPKEMRLSYFSQSVGEMKGNSALDEVILGNEKIRNLKSKLTTFENQLASGELDDDEMNAVLIKMGDVQTDFEKLGGYDLETRAEEVLTGLGISPIDHSKLVDEFSGGWKMRIALAKVLVNIPDIIIMDEPTNYLDIETILWLEDWLKNFKGAVFMTTHDRDFMNGIVQKVVEISNGKATTYSGNYDFYEKERQVRRDQIKAEYRRQQEMLSKEEEFIAKFKARASHAAQVQSRIKKLEKIDRVEIPPEEATIAFEFSRPDRGGDDVVVLNDLGKSWTKSNGEELKIFEHLSATVKRLDRIAVVGVNGAGKSTLLKIICGTEEPSSGSVKIGPSIRMGYFSQYSLEVLTAENTVLEEVRSNLKNASDGFLRNLLAAFLFRGDDVEKKVKYLSGGEKSRLILAVLLSQKNNLLVLEEPTNHLDLKSREVLLNALSIYEGTVIFVSHDRHFLHKLTKKVLEVDSGGIKIYPGNYDYYLSKKS